MRPLLTTILSLTAFALSHGASADDFEFKIPISQQNSGSYHIAGALEGKVELDFLVDTGAGMVILTERTFKSLAEFTRRKPSRRIAVRLADGRTNAVDVYTVEQLVLGESCNVGPLEVAVIAGAKHNILGMDVLNKAAPFAIYPSPPSLALSACSEPLSAFAGIASADIEPMLLQVFGESD